MKLDQRTVICELIRSRIEHLDEERRQAVLDQSSLEDAEGDFDNVPAVEHIYLGATQKPMTFNAVEEAKSSNLAFRDFRKKFLAFINTFAHANEIPLPNGTTWFVPKGQDKVRLRSFNRTECSESHTLSNRSKNAGTSKSITSLMWTGK